MANSKVTFGRILMFSLPIILAVALFLMIAKEREKRPEVIVAPEETDVLPTPEALTSTRWATDSAVLEIEKNILQIEKDLKEIDLKYTPLHPPTLDMRVKF